MSNATAPTTATPTDRRTISSGGAYEQAKAAPKIIESALASAGAHPSDVIRTVVYLTANEGADAVARAHLEMFDDTRPASTLIQVTSMIRDWQKVEIEAYPII